MSEAMYRHWAMLQLVPRAPRKISAQSLFNYLEAEGFDTTERTVQRDLIKLSKIFLLVSDERNKPFGWSWSKDAPIFDLPGMDVNTAITFYLSEQFLPKLMPPSIYNNMKPHTQRASSVLDNIAGKKFKSWRNKIQVLSRAQPLIPPEIDEHIVNSVYQALLEDKQIQLEYKTREGELKEYVVNPKGIVIRDHVTYLLGSFWGYEDIKQLLLHRMSQVGLLETPAKKFPFDLDEYIKLGNFEYVEQHGSIVLELQVSHFIEKHLSETPLSEDQMIVVKDSEHCIVTATVKDTQQLRWWLLGFGDGVEVLKPDHLRQSFKDIVKNMSKQYLQ